jgi:hypothetical protein
MNFVYVLSPDFYPHLFVSLRSLFSSKTTVSNVFVFSVGGGIQDKFGSLPINIIEVPTKSEDYWMLNKTYVSEVNCDEVCFIDSDVIIKKDISKTSNSGSDITARRSTAYTLDTYEEKLWEEFLRKKGAKKKVPILNAGFLWLRNGIHREIGEEWELVMRDAWERGFFGNGYHADQWSLPVVLGRRGATYSLLGPEDHALAWEGDPLEEATLYHTGASNFFSTVRSMENPDFLDADLPIPRPNVTWNYLKDRIGKKWKTLSSATPKAENQDVWLED